MKLRSMIRLGGLVVIAGLLASSRGTANSPATGKGMAALNQAAVDNKTVYLVLHREGNAATQAMAQAVKAYTDKHAAKATWASVRVTEAAERPVVDKFQLSRAPMPMVLAVHPNGAVTGAITKQVNEASLADCLATPKQADCTKRLQQNQLVFLCVHTSGQPIVPQGVRDFQADPHFAKRTGVVMLDRNDPNEAAFIGQLKLNPQEAAPVTVFMAPPGVLVGTFPATASKRDLSAALQAASKCCEDPNCKHGHK